MTKKKKTTLTMRFNEEYSKWMDLKNSYPKDAYDSLEDNLKNDQELLEEFFKFIDIVKSLRKRNYISKEKTLDIITSISYYPYGEFLDAMPENGIEFNGETYFKNF